MTSCGDVKRVHCDLISFHGEIGGGDVGAVAGRVRGPQSRILEVESLVLVVILLLLRQVVGTKIRW